MNLDKKYRAFVNHPFDRTGRSAKIELGEGGKRYNLRGVRSNCGYRKDIKGADSALYRHKEERTKAGEYIQESFTAGVSISPRPKGYRSEEGEVNHPHVTTAATTEGGET